MGTMRQRTPGTWELVVSAGLDPATGRYRRVIRTVKATSKREVKAALTDLEAAVAAGKVSFDIDRLYTKLRKRGLGPATIRQVHAILRASLNQPGFRLAAR